MKSSIAIIVSFFLFHSGVSWAAIEARCLDSKGKLSPCYVDGVGGDLHLQYKNKSQLGMNKIIEGKSITRISEGEYARRRVAESVTLAILVAPVALFGLFSKKKMDTFGVEYKQDGKPTFTMITTKKKYGMSMRSLLQSVSGKEVIIDEGTKNRK